MWRDPSWNIHPKLQYLANRYHRVDRRWLANLIKYNGCWEKYDENRLSPIFGYGWWRRRASKAPVNVITRNSLVTSRGSTGYMFHIIADRPSYGLIGSAVGLRSTAPGFKSQPGYARRMFQLRVGLVTFGGRSFHLAYSVHISGRKTAPCTFCIIALQRLTPFAVDQSCTKTCFSNDEDRSHRMTTIWRMFQVFRVVSTDSAISLF